MTGDTSDINAINTREMHRAQRLAIDGGVGDQDALRHQGLVTLLKVDVEFRADECHDGLLVSLSTYNEHLVTDMKDGIAVGDAELTLVYKARYYKVAVQKVVYLQQGLPLQILVCHLQVHLIGFLVGVTLFQCSQLELFVFEFHLAYIPY